MLTTLAVALLAQDARILDGGALDAHVLDARALEVPATDAGVEVPAPLLEKLAKNVDLSAGLGKGVTLSSGEFELQLRGRVQVLFLSQVPAPYNAKVPRLNSFAIRRARLDIKTKLPFHLSFRLQLAFARQDMELDEPNVLRDIFIEWRRFRDVSLRIGQFKVPFDVQRTISSSALQFADRSIVTQELNMERDIGVIAFSDDLFGLGHRLRYWAGIMGGDGRNRIGTNIGLLYIGRIAITPFGKIDDRLEGDPEREKRFRLSIGGAVARNVQSVRQRSTIGNTFTLGGFDYTHVTGDLHLKWYGFSLLAQLFFREADTDSRTNAAGTLTEWSRSGSGGFVQGGAYVTDWLELVARYGELVPFTGTDPGFHRTRELGAGINWMIQKHDLKLQLDYFWLDNGGWKDGRHQLRLQAQVYF